MVSLIKSSGKEMKKNKGAKTISQKKSISKTRKVKTSVTKEESCGIQTKKQLNTGDFYYDADQRKFNGKIKFWGDIDVPHIISDKLNREQLGMLKESAFGQFVNVEKRRMFTQVIRQGLLREIHNNDDSQIWFLFGEERSRFSLAEYCLISGLKGSGNPDLSDYEGVKNDFISKYFPEETVNRKLIRKKFIDAQFDTNEEAVRLANIFLVFNFILATIDENIVDNYMLNFLSCGDINSFPWGKVGFEILKKSLGHALKGNVKKVDRGVFKYNFYKDRGCRFYKLNGLVYVFQVFLFETILDLKQKGFCIDDQQSNVRLFKWMELGKMPSLKKLRDNVFGTRKMSVRFIVPTVEEIKRLELDDFKLFEITNNKNATEDEKKDKDTEPFDISELKEFIDSRMKLLNRKVKKMREEVRDLRNEVRSEMEEFHKGINKMVDEALKKLLHALKVDENDAKQQAGDNATSNNEEEDVSNGGTNDSVRENEPTIDKEKDIEVEAADNDAADIDATGMEVVLYTPKTGRKNQEVREEENLEMNFTTQDIIKIDEVVWTASKKRRWPVRAVKRGRALKSPYAPNAGSEDAPSKVATMNNPVEWLSAFPTVCMQMPSISENATFDQWFAIGLNKRKWYDKFPGLGDILTPPFSFGGVEIRSKMWFYRLVTPGQYMDNNHIDVCFYYLRKLARYSKKISIRVTTTYCWFHALLTGLYKSFNDHDRDESILTSDNFIVRYIQGTTAMNIGTRWADVDHVIFPIHMTRPEHWFMLAFDVFRRRLVAYNSFRNDGTQMKEQISDVCESYIYILPIILSKCGFWKTRTDIDRNSAGYIGVDECDHIELEIAKGLPEQVESDYGMFTIGFAEHYIHQKIEQIPNPFPVPHYRKKLYVNLYLHAQGKLNGEYESGTE